MLHENLGQAHWICLVGTSALFALTYIVFMKKYYNLRETYLASLEKKGGDQ